MRGRCQGVGGWVGGRRRVTVLHRLLPRQPCVLAESRGLETDRGLAPRRLEQINRRLLREDATLLPSYHPSERMLRDDAHSHSHADAGAGAEAEVDAGAGAGVDAHTCIHRNHGGDRPPREVHIHMHMHVHVPARSASLAAASARAHYRRGVASPARPPPPARGASPRISRAARAAAPGHTGCRLGTPGCRLATPRLATPGYRLGAWLHPPEHRVAAAPGLLSGRAARAQAWPRRALTRAQRLPAAPPPPASPRTCTRARRTPSARGGTWLQPRSA